jgi:hypothetical protein
MDQGTVEMAECRMHYHAGLFVDDEQMFILIHNVERNVFRYDFKVPFRVGHNHRNDITGLYFVIGLDGLFIGPDVPSVRSLLYFGTGSIGKARHQKFINPQGYLTTVGFDAVVFIHFIAAGLLFVLQLQFVRVLVFFCHRLLRHDKQGIQCLDFLIVQGDV